MYDNEESLIFLSRLTAIDFPFERIEHCIPALKYLAEKSGLTFNKEVNKDLEELTVLQTYTMKNFLTNELEKKEHTLIKLLINYKEKEVYFIEESECH